MARYRAAYEARTPIKVLTGAEGWEEQLLGQPPEVVAAVQQYKALVSAATVLSAAVRQHSSTSHPRMTLLYSTVSTQETLNQPYHEPWSLLPSGCDCYILSTMPSCSQR